MHASGALVLSPHLATIEIDNTDSSNGEDEEEEDKEETGGW